MKTTLRLAVLGAVETQIARQRRSFTTDDILRAVESDMNGPLTSEMQGDIARLLAAYPGLWQGNRDTWHVGATLSASDAQTDSAQAHPVN